ncbi:hypothetical protein GCM10010289_50720 [Streptomyces violascens]|uniref:Transposase n=1 Tax=Streptomyces violascens TaxID=67381 RepID=A0ABQ3QY93_9ACTN|nr:hypothetical protein GCM10010289_50720 [Streptomyces violascens]GHI42263.1 hypothetical protein Sviol_66710 [Streptomyces violascens]
MRGRRGVGAAARERGTEQGNREQLSYSNGHKRKVSDRIDPFVRAAPAAPEIPANAVQRYF